MKKITSLLVCFATSFTLSASWALEPFNNPTVSGPIPFSLPAGGDEHNYPFFSQADWLKDKNYIEQEFFLEGSATGYSREGEKIAEDVPYKTRMVVRRPADPNQFNGTVLLEWENVTAGYDLNALWSGFREDLVEAGYVWIGVSAQRVGVNQLREWSPRRYGSLDVTNGGKIERDAISWDIFGQAAQAIRAPKGINPLAGYNVQEILGEGASQSAGYLAPFYNNVMPLYSKSIDALLLAIGGAATRDDLDIPVFRTLAETDVLGRVRRGAEPTKNSDLEREWEIAGTSHSSYAGFMGRMVVAEREFGQKPAMPTCDRTAYSRIPTSKVYLAVYHHMVNWVREGTPPPIAPIIDRGGEDLARDENGNATGGIQLAEHAVPLAQNDGMNSGEARFCRLYGSHSAFSKEKINQLYPSKNEYLAKVRSVVDENLDKGFILKSGAEQTVREAEERVLGE